MGGGTILGLNLQGLVQRRDINERNGWSPRVNTHRLLSGPVSNNVLGNNETPYIPFERIAGRRENVFRKGPNTPIIRAYTPPPWNPNEGSVQKRSHY